MQIKTIANTKVLFKRNQSKIINIQILTDIGSSDESQNEYGVAHFLEHMFFKGTNSRNAKRINRDADLMGAKINAWTWHDQTNYYLSVMEENFEAGFELLSDIYLNATFPEDEFEKEKTVILSEIRRYEDDPPTFISDLAVDYYCQNGLAHKVIGTYESVAKLTKNDLINFKNKYYGGDNILISIVGDIDFKRVSDTIEKYFFNKPSTLPNKLKTGEYKPGYYKLKKAELQESQYLLLYPALPHLDKQAPIQGIMSYVLGGNSSALLFERIREELGLCYGIYARVNRFEGFNYIEISTGCSEKDLNLLHSEVLQIINKLKTDLIDSERLEMIKASMLSSLYMSIENSAGLNSFFGLSYMKGDRGDILQKRINEIKSVTRESIREIAQMTFQVEPLRAELLAT